MVYELRFYELRFSKSVLFNEVPLKFCEEKTIVTEIDDFLKFLWLEMFYKTPTFSVVFNCKLKMSELNWGPCKIRGFL